MMRTTLVTALLAVAIVSPLAFAADTPRQDELPKVLIIGDSISIGYTPHVKQLMEGKAAVKHHKGNAGPTEKGLKNIDAWLGDTNWDVIHFNWGLHDLCYRHPDAKAYGHRDKVKGTVSTTLEQYDENLRTLVDRLKKTDAKLIWARTTLVPEGEAGRKVGDDVKYNEVADKVMKEHGIPINDLYSLTAAFPADHFTKPGDVHYTKAAYEKIARQVAEAIGAALNPAP